MIIYINVYVYWSFMLRNVFYIGKIKLMSDNVEDRRKKFAPI